KIHSLPDQLVPTYHLTSSFTVLQVMASNMLPEKQFYCPVCEQVFTDPVTTPCGHNFCQACIQSKWEGTNVCQCPACDRSFPSRPEMSINIAFKELADTFKQMIVCSSAAPLSSAQPGEVVCDVCAATSLQVKALKSCLVCLTSYCESHLEPHKRVVTLKLHKLMEPVKNLQDRMCKKHERLLEMFCRDEQKCVCQFCTETEHRDHKVVSVEESDRLFTSLIHTIKERQTEVNAEIKEKQKAVERRAEEFISELQQEITELQRRNTEMEELKNTEDHLHLLQHLPSITSPPPTKEWMEINIPPELCVGTVRRALSKLYKLKLFSFYLLVDVVLDPDTAHPNIVLTADGKQAGRGELLHVVPDNPQRFDPVICVLAKQGYISGRFYFQVSVGQKTFWDLGVVKGSVNRKGMITSKPENGYWTVRLRNGDEYRALDSPSVRLPLKEKPEIVGVFTDYDKGTVSFFDVEARSHIYTFTGCLFSEKVYPFFSPGVCDEGKNKGPLIITTVNHES
uniref:E3 ubiquitin-protein ligase TRIM39-like n=1 Tax=Neolamprologus brichardi TaxID=32507 RepID=A0A3Q4HPF7_NEOBR